MDKWGNIIIQISSNLPIEVVQVSEERYSPVGFCSNLYVKERKQRI